MTEDSLPKSQRVLVTAEFLAESQAKQAAYAASRRRHMAAFDRGDEDSEDDNTGSDISPMAVPTKKRTRRRIEDKRQLRFEL